MPSRRFTLEEIEAHQKRHGLNKHPRQANCSCRVSDAWACARDLGLNRVACQCGCHRYLVNAPAEPSSSPVVISEPQKGVPIPEKGVKGRGGLGKRRKEMNQTEREFSRILDGQVDEGKIESWAYERITLRWGELDNIQYTPDFTVHAASCRGITLAHLDAKNPDARIKSDHFIYHRFIEVKGAHIWPKDIEKFKAARNQFPFYEFQLWQKKDHAWTQLY